MEKVTPRTLSGFMELLPADQLKMERLLGTLRRVYSLYGFTPLDTPAIESAEVLLAKGGGETEKQIYRFMKGDSDLALRFDLTVPLAKYVAANYAKLQFPFRRFQIGKVWRGERAQRGRFREFYQADIDVIGDGKLDIMNEAEIPSIICRAFTELGLRDFTIRINNRKVLGGFFRMHGMSAPAEILRTIDKLEKIGAEKVRAILLEDCGLDESQAAAVLDFTGFTGTTAEKLAFLEGMCGRDELFDEGVRELRTVAEALPGLGVPPERFALDFTIARGLDYYTGTVYETTINSHPEIGSVCSGGRYDDLAEYYTDRKLPGAGISIGVTRLFYVLSEQGLLNPELEAAPADAIVLPMTEDLGFAAETATLLRESGIRTQLYTEEKKFKQKLSYASKLGIPFAVIIGEDEAKSGLVSLKDMRRGEQISCAPAEAAEKIKAALAESAGARLIKEK
ncbi:MAG TPA: histidine--tRNA ligase [Candidatus Scatomorpha merdavium]|nr:histidine--tRNA ligase [Candidatus Scatomorpha merdavium]